MEATVHGTCDPRFAAVRDVFAANLAGGREVGASFAATVDGRPVVDLWGGHADAARTRPWEQDTIVNVFSTTKAMTALCAHVLVDRGLLDVDAPVARYWPEFAQAGKETIPVRILLSHTAGLAAVRRAARRSTRCTTGTGTVERSLPRRPGGSPGTASGYHALTYGHLVGEVVRRITGRRSGRFLRDEFAGPLGADFHIGLAANDDDRCGEMVPPIGEEARGGRRLPLDPESLLGKVTRNPPLRRGDREHTAWRRGGDSRGQRARQRALGGAGHGRVWPAVASSTVCGCSASRRSRAPSRSSVMGRTWYSASRSAGGSAS